MKLINECYSEGKYQTRNWYAEKTYKYVFGFAGGYVEAGCFIHFADGQMKHYIEHVIELSTSIGCNMKCTFCASSEIKNTRILTVQEIFDVYNYIYMDKVQKFPKPVNLVVSFLGIGDLFYTLDNVIAAMEKIRKIDESILFNLSSCFWTSEMLKRIEMSHVIDKVKTMQITYVSTENKIVNQLIRGLSAFNYNFRSIIIDMINTFSQWKIRINYLVIKGVNDSFDDFRMFAEMLEGIESRVVVRVSKLNTTAAANKNNLHSSDISRMNELVELLGNIQVEAYLFYSYKNDKMNCGQLITEGYLCEG